MSTLLLDPRQESLEKRPDLRRLTVEDIIEREIDSGVAFGPFHRSWLNQKSPEKVRKLLELAAKRPDLVGTNAPFQGPNAPIKSLTKSNTAVTASATETNLWVPAFQTPIAAGDMEPGKNYEIKFGGVFTSTGTPGVLTWTPRAGVSATPSSNVALGASNATAPAASLTGQAWFGEFLLTIRLPDVTAGACTGTGNGLVVTQGAAAATGTLYVLGGTVATTIDNTAQSGLIVSLTISVASQSYTCQHVSPCRSYN